MSLLNFQMMLEDMAPGAKSTCGLSNISNGPPEHLRPILNQTYMCMLWKYGMTSCIFDPLDKQGRAIAKQEKPEIVDLIWGMMDGNDPGLDGLDADLVDYYKTYKVIMGETLYSDSWLEI